MFILLTIIGSAIAIFLLCHIKIKWRFRTINKIVSPPGWPILGNVLLFWDFEEWFYTLKAINEKYGSMIKFWLGPFECFLVTTDLGFVEFILNSPKYLHKASNYQKLEPWVGQGIATCTDINLWRKRRTMLNPAFHLRTLEEFIPVFHAQGEYMINNLKKHTDEKVFNVYPYSNAYAMDVICETAMGVQINTQQNPGNDYMRSLDSITSIVFRRVFSVFKRFDIPFMLTSDYRMQKKCIKIVHDFDKRIIKERREKMLQMKGTNLEDMVDEFGVKKRMAFLDVLLQATIDGQPLTDQAILDEVDTFMFTGHDTLSSSISFALYAISNHPDVQAKIVEELKLIFDGDPDKAPNMQQLHDMKYTEMVINETLRLYPTSVLVGRKLVEDTVYNGTVFPKGLEVIVLLSGILLNPELYPNPDKFDPERFSDLATNKRRPFSYIPFSAGQRNCIGNKYALLQLKVALARLLRKFEFLPAGPGYDIKLFSALVTKSLTGMHLRLRTREF